MARTARGGSRRQSEALEGSGVIEKMARNRKAFKLEGDEEWYSVYKAPQMNDAQVGDTVSFEYEDKDTGGQIFHNIQGNVNIDEEGEGEPAPSRGSSSRGGSSRRAASGGGRSGGGGGAKSDGVDWEAKDRRISRQSSLKVAAEIISAIGDYEGDVEAAGVAAIDMARTFEEYIYEEV